MRQPLNDTLPKNNMVLNKSIKSWNCSYGVTIIFNFNQILNSISNNLDYIIFDILNQFNILCFWPISPKLGLAIINFKPKINKFNLSSFPLISNHFSISIGKKNQLIPHVISNNHKNAGTEASKHYWCCMRAPIMLIDQLSDF